VLFEVFLLLLLVVLPARETGLSGASKDSRILHHHDTLCAVEGLKAFYSSCASF
jgi:hypothetical protein